MSEAAVTRGKACSDSRAEYGCRGSEGSLLLCSTVDGWQAILIGSASVAFLSVRKSTDMEFEINSALYSRIFKCQVYRQKEKKGGEAEDVSIDEDRSC